MYSRPLLLVGAGNVGRSLINQNPNALGQIVAVFDNDPQRIGQTFSANGSLVPIRAARELQGTIHDLHQSGIRPGAILAVDSPSIAKKYAETCIQNGIDTIVNCTSADLQVPNDRKIDVHNISHDVLPTLPLNLNDIDHDLLSQVHPLLAVSESRYEREFEEIARLGRGGYGSVFHCLNRLDDTHYAVKKVCVSLKGIHDSGRLHSVKLMGSNCERALREVRAMASIPPHQGIVRYHNCWLEFTSPKKKLERRTSSCSFESGLQDTSSPQDSSDSFDNFFPHFEESENELEDLVPNPFACSPLTSGTFSTTSSVTAKSSKSASTSTSTHSLHHNPNSAAAHPVTPSKNTTTHTAATHGGEMGPGTTVNNHTASASTMIPAVTLYIQMGLGPTDTLQSELESSEKRMSPRTALQVFTRIAEAVRHIHEHGFAHRDLKPSNILYKDGSIQITDFGLAKCATRNDSDPDGSDADSHARHDVMAGAHHSSGLGTYLYAAPELLEVSKKNSRRKKLDVTDYDVRKCDVYSLGVILIELFCPFTTRMERATVLNNLRRPGPEQTKALPPSFLKNHPEVAALALSLLSLDPSARPAMSSVVLSLSRLQFQSQAPFRKSILNSFSMVLTNHKQRGDPFSPGSPPKSTEAMGMYVNHLENLVLQQSQTNCSLMEEIEMLRAQLGQSKATGSNNNSNNKALGNSDMNGNGPNQSHLHGPIHGHGTSDGYNTQPASPVLPAPTLPLPTMPFPLPVPRNRTPSAVRSHSAICLTDYGSTVENFKVQFAH
eukprot:TRINITY_DN1778_c0_g1::TRINITY_DN1778_c0_g1_i1::g.25195::m.25195 TRINITY_DN1778_c0_g1::TRINITY_DN1778_c0_g1_i1::g.25195  ORF type:complete len:777 (-),score=127.99,sp/Q4R8E0/E2AK1_MACFA/30.72/1e-37,Pkinase/PF00069.20/6.8e-05,Pkinase/PF00069.20/7.8e-31,Pkinase_Tyr/PF07714.12/2.2,Pkinase_Tyr/PF07714.12/3.9e-15,CoA_binding/PF02629.14/0.00025,CoA_binding/PF02629.14/1.3e+04,Kdo/PF06293.9/0.00085,APH/PF01636.18/0.0055,Choline_kinase/PF01633.15/0.016,DapB_N/PF01113.15/0.21,DapB_N/PF01113.15/7.6e+03 TRIN